MTTIKTPFKYADTQEYLNPPVGGHSACPGCGEILAMRYFLKAVGDHILLVMPPGCAGANINAPGPSLPPNIRALATPFMTSPIIAGGLCSALRARGDSETTVIAWTGDGATFDIGLAGLSGAAERNEDIIYVCYDNEGYMNTGNQRSSATPQGARTSTNPDPTIKSERKKDIMQIMAAHSVPYAATASIAFPDDLMSKARKAKQIKGFRFFHILAPCPTGWAYRSEKTIEIARLAVETRLFPLYEIENGVYARINREPSGAPVQEYVQAQGRFRSLTSEQISSFQQEIDQKWQRLKYLIQAP
jgi:pyruvate/2-oxoacid:ferredoxin oxidoreductase beta subunit